MKEIDRIDSKDLSYEGFVASYLSPNLPCLVSGCLESWGVFQAFQTFDSSSITEINGLPESKEREVEENLKRFFDSKCCVPVVVENKGDNTTSEYGEAVCKQFLLENVFRLWKQNESEFEMIPYLKDWHFLKDLKLKQDQFYNIPRYFKEDWLNDWCKKTEQADYKFLYLGPKNSCTRKHHDVFFSYSWSANVVGRKRWRFFREQDGVVEEESLEVIQYPGEIMFVPSGWLHEVVNLDLTLSINHNWLNQHCLKRVAKYLMSELEKTRAALVDIKSDESTVERFEHEYESTCQHILKLNIGLNVQDLLDIIYQAKQNGTAEEVIQQVIAFLEETFSPDPYLSSVLSKQRPVFS